MPTTPAAIQLPPCPPWCVLTPGHGRTFRDARTGQREVRRLHFGEHVPDGHGHVARREQFEVARPDGELRRAAEDVAVIPASETVFAA